MLCCARPLAAKILLRRGTSVLYWETWACAIWVVPAISNAPLHFCSKYVPEPPRRKCSGSHPLWGPRPCVRHPWAWRALVLVLRYLRLHLHSAHRDSLPPIRLSSHRPNKNNYV
ncbi:Uncharacterized protein HZ326_19592 [Fusarium oxysporum f. sp. albedinis]|nr:Uncharacterized protein HZ326_19592 [Fusarium oxysporum f. sp. albedinis]